MTINYEVSCTSISGIITKEYFEYYEDALLYQISEHRNYADISITHIDDEPIVLAINY